MTSVSANDSTRDGAATAPDDGRDVTEITDAIRDFFANHPQVNLPYYVTLSVDVATRADLDALAGDFDQPPPRPATHYRGGQFVVRLLSDKTTVQVLFAFHEADQ